MTEHDKYNLLAPDVCQGPDGRHYLVTCIWVFGYVSVAVSVSPAGPFSHLGIVAHSDGFILYGGVRFDRPCSARTGTPISIADSAPTSTIPT